MHKARFVIIAIALTAACNNGGDMNAETEANQIAGVASVVDGDTIDIHGDRIRLDGFDTPERGSSCGAVNVYQKAAFTLSNHIGNSMVTCSISGKDRYGRSVGDCSVRGESLAEYMVEEGWGRDWPQYSGRAYADEEKRARKSNKGIWGLDCPADVWGDRTYD